MKLHTFWHYPKLFLTFFVIILIPVYWHYYGPQNFLWLSDIGLFLTIIALWLHSTLLMSMAAVGVLFVEILWNVDFFAHLFFNVTITGLSDYMFNSTYPYALRALSLFHIVMPGIWLVYSAQKGYDRRALLYFTPLYWAIIFSTYWLTVPEENINWVFWSSARAVQTISPQMGVILLAIGFPLLILLPTHIILKKMLRKVS